MPIYDYLCQTCNKTSTLLFLRSTEERVPSCQHCGSANVKRILSSVFLPKGSGRRIEDAFERVRHCGLDEENPIEIERCAKRLGDDLGDEPGEGFRESLIRGLSDASGSADGHS